MGLWAKIDVDMPQDPKLYARPLLERHLWTCLVCLAKKSFPDGVVIGFDAAALSSMFNLGSAKGTQAGLDYFAAQRMLEPIAFGFRLINFVRRQARKDNPEAVRLRVQEHRSRNGAGNGHVTGTVTGRPPVTRVPVTAIEVELEKEVDQEKERKEEKGSSSFSQDPEIARESKTDATPTEQAQLVHALGLDRRAARG